MEVAFTGSFPSFHKIPETKLPEVCFWGRSNVGKSSLINSICQRKDLAKVSGTPGKTREFVQYVMDNRWCLMDLPGYGYARVAKKLKNHWAFEFPRYLTLRKNLCLLLLLVDSSIEPQEIDLSIMRFLGEHQIPFYIILTKIDKCTKLEMTKFRSQLKNKLAKDWESIPPIFEVSAKLGDGKTELLNEINRVIYQIESEGH